MNLTRRIDLVGYLHIGYGAVLLLLSALSILVLTVGVLLLPALASWLSGLGATLLGSLLLAAIGLPSMVAGVLLIRRAAYSRAAIILLSVVDLFAFPVGTALGMYSVWILMKERSRMEFA